MGSASAAFPPGPLLRKPRRERGTRCRGRRIAGMLAMGRLLGALLCFAALGAPLVSALKRAPQKALRALKRELGDAVVIVDGDNVRGKADFRWSKAAL